MTTLQAIQAEIDAIKTPETLVQIIKLAAEKLSDEFGIHQPLTYAANEIYKTRYSPRKSK